MTNFERLSRRQDVSTTAKGLLLIIVSFGRNGSCRPTREALMARSGMADNTLEKYLRELRLAGELNMHRCRDEEGHVRTMFIPFPPLPERLEALPQFLG